LIPVYGSLAINAFQGRINLLQIVTVLGDKIRAGMIFLDFNRNNIQDMENISDNPF